MSEFKQGDRVKFREGLVGGYGIVVGRDGSDYLVEITNSGPHKGTLVPTPSALIERIERIQEEPMHLTPEWIERVAQAVIDYGMPGSEEVLWNTVKTVLEEEAKPKPRVFTVTLPHDITLGPMEIRDCLLGTAHIAAYEDEITVEEVTL